MSHVGLAVTIGICDSVLAVGSSCDSSTVVPASAPPVGLDVLSNSVAVVEVPRARNSGSDTCGCDTSLPRPIIVGNSVSSVGGASGDTSWVPAALVPPVGRHASSDADCASGRRCADEDRVHVGVSVSVIVSDVVAASGVHAGDCSGVPPAISTVVAHYFLAYSESLNSVVVSGKWLDLGRVEGLFVTIVVLNHVPVVAQYFGYASRVPAATALEVALYSRADEVLPVFWGPEPGLVNIPLNIAVSEAKRVDALSILLPPRVDDSGRVEAAGEARTL